MSWSTLNSYFQWLSWCFLTRKPFPHSARATPGRKSCHKCKDCHGIRWGSHFTPLHIIRLWPRESHRRLDLPWHTYVNISMIVGFKGPKFTSAFIGDQKSSFWSFPMNIYWQEFKFVLDIDTMVSTLVNEINAFHDELKVSSLLQLRNQLGWWARHFQKALFKFEFACNIQSSPNQWTGRFWVDSHFFPSFHMSFCGCLCSFGWCLSLLTQFNEKLNGFFLVFIY